MTFLGGLDHNPNIAPSGKETALIQPHISAAIMIFTVYAPNIKGIKEKCFLDFFFSQLNPFFLGAAVELGLNAGFSYNGLEKAFCLLCAAYFF